MQAVLKPTVSETKLKVDAVTPILQTFDAKDVPKLKSPCRSFQGFPVKDRGLAVGEEPPLGIAVKCCPYHLRPKRRLRALPSGDLRNKHQQQDTYCCTLGKLLRVGGSWLPPGSSPFTCGRVLQAGGPFEQPLVVIVAHAQFRKGPGLSLLEE